MLLLDHNLSPKLIAKLGDSTVIGQPPKVIHLTLGNCSVADCASAILGRSGHVKDFLGHPSKAYLVLP